MSSPTKDDLRDEIRELLGVPDYAAGATTLRSNTLSKAAEAIGVENRWGGGPSLRQQIRQQLAKREADGLVDEHITDGADLRKAELVQLRDALQEEDDG